MVAREGDDLALDRKVQRIAVSTPVQHAEEVLRRVQAHALVDRGEDVAREVADPDVQDLPAVAQATERVRDLRLARRPVERRDPVLRPVQLVEVDAIGAESAQARIDRDREVLVGVRLARERLRGQEDPIAAPLEDLAEPLLRRQVGLRGVKEVPAGVEGGVHRPAGTRIVHGPIAATERVATKTEPGWFARHRAPPLNLSDSPSRI